MGNLVDDIRLAEDKPKDVLDAAVKVAEKVKGYGYSLNGVNADVIIESVLETREYIINVCNIDDIPSGLFYTWVSLSCANFLESYFMSGYVNVDDENAIRGDVKSITEGDVSVSYGGSEETNPAIATKDLILRLRESESAYLLRFRRLQW